MNFDLIQTFLRKIANVESDLLNKLDSMETFKDKVSLCRQELGKELGEGSSRIVFDYDKDKVIKLAKNSRGLAQNKVESDKDFQKYDCIPKVFIKSKDHNYIIVDKVKKLTEKKFEEITGISFDDFCDYIEAEDNKESVDKKNAKNKLAKEIIDIMFNFKLPRGDMMRLSSYGELDRKVYLIDYGLTNKVYDKYYTK